MTEKYILLETLTLTGYICTKEKDKWCSYCVLFCPRWWTYRNVQECPLQLAQIIFFTISLEICSKFLSTSVGFSDHNIIAVARKTKVPNAGPKVLCKRLYTNFGENAFVEDMSKIRWENVVKWTQIDKHTHIRKLTVRTTRAHWLDLQLRSNMTERDQLKKSCECIWVLSWLAGLPPTEKQSHKN